MTASRGIGSARLAVSALFLANGFTAGLWSVFVPVVQRNLGIGEADMGWLILTGASAGFVGLMLSGILVARMGSRPVAVLSGLALAPGLLLLSTASQFTVAVAFFVLFFLAMSIMDVAMNANGAETEKLAGKAIMSSFHGFWSMGGMLGAASGGFLLAMFGQSGIALASATACLALTGLAYPFLVPPQAHGDTDPASARVRAFRLPGSPMVYVFGLFALAAFTAEGSVIDWSALFLRKEMSADVEFSGFAFAGFSCAMMISRFGGDGINRRFGAMRLLQWSSALAVAGFLLAGLGPSLPLVIAGFLVAGLGCANIVPLAFSAASNVPGVKPSTGIAIATMCGYFGLLCAPALLGGIGETFGFRPVYAGFGLVMVLVLVAAGLLRRHRP
ncbi:MAG: MFS transporter [Nitratireductor sp.]|nr:MFS transporter [Nitratireductor sp.]